MLHRFQSFSTFPLHITGRCPRSEWSELPLSCVWKIFCKTIEEFQKEFAVQTHAFVLMDNHYHWLCIYEQFEKDERLFAWFQEVLSFELFHAQFSKNCLEQIEYVFFEADPKITVIDHPQMYKNSYYYIYRNPILAGLVSSAEKYPYSTLPMVLGRQRMHFFCEDHMNVIYHPQEILQQINGFRAFH